MGLPLEVRGNLSRLHAGDTGCCIVCRTAGGSAWPLAGGRRRVSGCRAGTGLSLQKGGDGGGMGCGKEKREQRITAGGWLREKGERGMLHTARLSLLAGWTGTYNRLSHPPAVGCGWERAAGLEVCVVGVWAAGFVLGRQVNRAYVIG
jgi:hypothetical protein